VEKPANPIDWAKAANLAESAALEVGARIATHISENKAHEITFKGEIDITTEVDLWSERTIRMRLEKEFPEALFIGEESSAELLKQKQTSIEELVNNSRLAWIIDPIDGTNNFSNHIPHVAVSIALLEYGVPKVGIAYDPVRKEMFRAIQGQGTTLNGKTCAPSTKNKLIDAICGVSFPVDRAKRWDFYWSALEPLVLNCRTARVLGSGVLNICWTACGRLDGVVEHNLKIWDLAAAVLIAQEAGCSVANSDTNEIDEKNQPVNLFKRCLVVSGPNLFEPLYKMVSDSRKV